MEIWKEILDYPGYFVSNEGRIKSCKQDKNGKILKGKINKGYITVDLRKEGKTYNFALHRLVLSAFCPIENEKNYTVNHKDGDRFNNTLDNLEWLTLSENTAHARHILKSGKAAIAVRIVENDGTEKIYSSISEAAQDQGVAKTTISRWISGQRKYTGKYQKVESI